MGMGGSTGSMMGGGMDLQPHKMPIVGGFFTNPQEQHKQEQFQRAGEAFGAYRPEAAQARMNALSNQSTAYQSANNLLGRMSGGQGGFRGGQMFNTPMGPSMMSVGQPASLNQPSGGMGIPGMEGMIGQLMGGQGGMPGMPPGMPPMPGMPGQMPGGPPGMPPGFNPFAGSQGGL